MVGTVIPHSSANPRLASLVCMAFTSTTSACPATCDVSTRCCKYAVFECKNTCFDARPRWPVKSSGDTLRQTTTAVRVTEQLEFHSTGARRHYIHTVPRTQEHTKRRILPRAYATQSVLPTLDKTFVAEHPVPWPRLVPSISCPSRSV